VTFLSAMAIPEHYEFCSAISATADWQLENQIACCRIIASLSPSDSLIESERRHAGIALGHRKPYSLNAVCMQEIHDERQKLPSNTSTSIAVINRESKYLSCGGVSYAVAHYATIVDTLPEFHATTQYVRCKRQFLPRS